METNDTVVINRIVRRHSLRASGRFLIEAGIERLLRARDLEDDEKPNDLTRAGRSRYSALPDSKNGSQIAADPPAHYAGGI